MPSFDIVSELDDVEVRNAVDNANRELATRFDFRGVQASFEFKDDAVIMTAEGDFQLKQMQDILRNACVKRGVDTAVMDIQKMDVTGKTYKQSVMFKQGIEQPFAKKIVKLIKDKKLKVQTSIQGDELRVTGKKRDDLQSVISLLKSQELEQPLQYKNFRD